MPEPARPRCFPSCFIFFKSCTRILPYLVSNHVPPRCAAASMRLISSSTPKAALRFNFERTFQHCTHHFFSFTTSTLSTFSTTVCKFTHKPTPSHAQFPMFRSRKSGTESSLCTDVMRALNTLHANRGFRVTRDGTPFDS